MGEQPGWSDVAEVVVTHDRRVLEVAIRLCDVPVPDANRQLNLLHVHDTDGDGQADREVWATLTPKGWHASRFVATDGRAIPVPAGGIEIEQDADVVRIVVPRNMVDPLPRDWAVGAESGTAADFAVQQTWRDTAPNSPGVVKHPADG